MWFVILKYIVAAIQYGLVRDRVDAIKDKDSEVLEIGALAGYELEYGTVPSSSTYCAIATVHGVMSMFIASDATVKGGTIYPITLQKNLRASHIAKQNNLAYSVLKHLVIIYYI